MAEPQPLPQRGPGAAQRAEQSRWMAQIAARGDDARLALKLLFLAYDKGMVRRLQNRFGLDLAEAQDVWHDTVLDVWNHASGFRPGADLAPWLVTLAGNRALKLLDQAWRRHRSELHEGDGGAADADDDAPNASGGGPALHPSLVVADTEPPPAMDAHTCTDLGLKEFERHYPVDARWLFARDLEGRNVPSLATEMGCSEDAARQRLRLMRQKLRRFLEHCVPLLRDD